MKYPKIISYQQKVIQLLTIHFPKDFIFIILQYCITFQWQCIGPIVFYYNFGDIFFLEYESKKPVIWKEHICDQVTYPCEYPWPKAILKKTPIPHTTFVLHIFNSKFNVVDEKTMGVVLTFNLHVGTVTSCPNHALFLNGAKAILYVQENKVGMYTHPDPIDSKLVNHYRFLFPYFVINNMYGTQCWHVVERKLLYKTPKIRDFLSLDMFPDGSLVYLQQDEENKPNHEPQMQGNVLVLDGNYISFINTKIKQVKFVYGNKHFLFLDEIQERTKIPSKKESAVGNILLYETQKITCVNVPSISMFPDGSLVCIQERQWKPNKKQNYLTIVDVTGSYKERETSAVDCICFKWKLYLYYKNQKQSQLCVWK